MFLTMTRATPTSWISISRLLPEDYRLILTAVMDGIIHGIIRIIVADGTIHGVMAGMIHGTTVVGTILGTMADGIAHGITAVGTVPGIMVVGMDMVDMAAGIAHTMAMAAEAITAIDITVTADKAIR